MLTSKSMLLTRSSGYTVLSCYRRWGQQKEPFYFKRDRERNSLRSVQPFSNSIGVACNRLLIQPCPAALCVSSHLTMGQITGPLQGTNSFSAAYHTQLACPALCPVVKNFAFPVVLVYRSAVLLLITVVALPWQASICTGLIAHHF